MDFDETFIDKPSLAHDVFGLQTLQPPFTDFRGDFVKRPLLFEISKSRAPWNSFSETSFARNLSDSIYF